MKFPTAVGVFSPVITIPRESRKAVVCHYPNLCITLRPSNLMHKIFVKCSCRDRSILLDRRLKLTHHLLSAWPSMKGCERESMGLDKSSVRSPRDRLSSSIDANVFNKSLACDCSSFQHSFDFVFFFFGPWIFCYYQHSICHVTEVKFIQVSVCVSKQMWG